MKDTPNDGRDNNDGSDGPKCEGEVQGGLLDGILGLVGSFPSPELFTCMYQDAGTCTYFLSAS
jgi:hypothetical protein